MNNKLIKVANKKTAITKRAAVRKNVKPAMGNAAKAASIPRSRVFESIHSAAKGLFSVGAIDKETMRQFDESCLIELPVVSPSEVRHIREKWHVSQPVLAMRLGISASTVKKWESGDNPVKGPAAIVLRMIEKGGFEAITV